MFRKTVILDLECVPDLEVYRALGSSGPKEGEFPPPLAHSIVNASILSFGYDLDGGAYGFRMESFRADRLSEEEIICEVERRLPEPSDFSGRVCGYNVRDYDMRVLIVRSMRAMCPPVPRIAALSELSRDDERLLDLRDFMGGRSPGRSGTLAEACALNGVPVKLTAHGADVIDLIARGEWDRVAAYCEEDVSATFLLMLHVEAARCHINKAALWLSWLRFAEWIHEGGDRRRHLAAFTSTPILPKLRRALIREARHYPIDLTGIRAGPRSVDPEEGGDAA